MKVTHRGLLASLAVMALVALFVGLVAPPAAVANAPDQAVQESGAPPNAVANAPDQAVQEIGDTALAFQENGLYTVNQDTGTFDAPDAFNEACGSPGNIVAVHINAENNTASIAGELNAKARTHDAASLQSAEKAYRNADAGRDQRTALAVNPNGGATGDVLNLPHGNVGNTA